MKNPPSIELVRSRVGLEKVWPRIESDQNLNLAEFFHDCGAPACVGGHFMAAKEMRALGIRRMRGGDAGDHLMKMLGLNVDQTNELFGGQSGNRTVVEEVSYRKTVLEGHIVALEAKEACPV